uniref:Uncharacterized protein n=1 Tax=Amphimedon queenslandica TaxID=400682 RepID=A0A1X7VLJ9_AMPQE
MDSDAATTSSIPSLFAHGFTRSDTSDGAATNSSNAAVESHSDCEKNKKELQLPQNVCVSGGSNADVSHFSASDSHFDVANLTNEYASCEEVDTAIKFGPKPNPRIFRGTVKAIAFRLIFLSVSYRMVMIQLEIGLSGVYPESLCCFPCRLFKLSSSTGNAASALSCIAGWLKKGWRKLYDRVPEHECRVLHRQHYLEWRTAERRLLSGAGIDTHIEKEICALGSDISLQCSMTMSNELPERAAQFMDKYRVDVSEQLLKELKQLKSIHKANFGTVQLSFSTTLITEAEQS